MNNPLLTDDLLPKFGHIRTEHMETAIDQILSENRMKIQTLAQQEDPSWETLAQPMQEWAGITGRQHLCPDRHGR